MIPRYINRTLCRLPCTAALFLAASLVVSCTTSQTTDEHHEDGHGHWSYAASTGPEHWGSLEHEYAVLDKGREQSPIDLKAGATGTGNPLTFDYGTTKLNLVNNGHTVQQNVDPGSYVTYQGRKYRLLQFHFHSGSEHTIEGKRKSLEMHLVHQAANGEFLVVGILFQPGAANSFLKQFWNRIPAHADETVTDAATAISLSDCVPAGSPVYAYDGSFTTPPGTEGVKWFVFSEPESLSILQLAKFRQLYSNNFRPVQPLHGRLVTLYD